MGNQPTVGRIALYERPEIRSLVQPLVDALGAKNFAIDLVTDLLSGIIRTSVPDFPGQIKLNLGSDTTPITMEYPRLPEEVRFGGKTVELIVGIICSDRTFLTGGHLTNKHYQKFNESLDCLRDFFQKIGWKVDPLIPRK